MAIVTISHQLGSGGGEVAHAVAERLGYRSVGAEVLAEAAQRYGLVEERLTRLGEAKPAFLDRLAAETQTYIAVMQSAVYEAVRDDDVVVLGRGGQWLLRDVPHVLRVRLIAPFEVRVRRLAEAFTSGTGRPPSAPAPQHAVADLVRRDDADKAGRLRYLYDRDINDPRLYDLMVNTAKGDQEGAIDLIVRAAQRTSSLATPAGRQLIADRALAARVLVALLSDEDTRGYHHDRVEASAGVVTITGGASLEVVEPVARRVDGVREVRTVEIPILPPSSLV
ncbi:MAG TPA: cytidylate kinase-like family protein [Methylomirabilota bacterium]|jgi:cytidylate kinase|nr:cytidylate kinase-like family protein [Methylomirabilota bacterium]